MEITNDTDKDWLYVRFHINGTHCVFFGVKPDLIELDPQQVARDD
jgi:hypothetical protein